MRFTKGNNVYLKSLKKHGVVLSSPRERHYLVGVGSVVVACKEEDLVNMPHPELTERGKVRPRGKPSPRSRSRSMPKVDLHGLRVADALKVVEDRMDRALLADADGLEVVHGVGEGKIRQALHKYLAQQGVVSSFKLDEGNPGVTWVYF